MAKGLYFILMLVLVMTITGCSGGYEQKEYTSDVVVIDAIVTTTTLPEIVVPEENTTQVVVITHKTYNVNITYYGFEPETLEIKEGDKVVWTSIDQRKPVNVIRVFFNDDRGRRVADTSGRLFYSDQFSHTYASKGSFPVVDLSFSDETERDKTKQTVVVR